MIARIVLLLRGNINTDSRVQKEIDTLISFGFKVSLIVLNSERINYKKESLEIISINLREGRSPYRKLITFLNILRFWYFSSKIIKKQSYNYIHCNDLDTLGVLFFLSREFNERIIYDAHELFPEMYPINSIRYKFWNILEKQLIKRIKTIIIPELNRSIYFKKKYKLDRIPYIINNFPKYKIIKPKDIKGELFLSKNDILLTYSGRFGPDREIDVIIESLKFLPNNFYLVLVGFADNKDYLETLCNFIKDLEVTNRVIFYGKISPEEIISTIAGCDIGLAFYKNNNINNYFCASGKVFDYIMAGLKLISNEYPSLKFLKEYNFVRLINEISPRIIAETAMDIVNNDSEIPYIVKKRFSWEFLEHKLLNIYR